MKREEALRREVMKLPSGKGEIFTVERKEASMQEGSKLHS